MSTLLTEVYFLTNEILCRKSILLYFFGYVNRKLKKGRKKSFCARIHANPWFRFYPSSVKKNTAQPKGRAVFLVILFLLFSDGRRASAPLGQGFVAPSFSALFPFVLFGCSSREPTLIRGFISTRRPTRKIRRSHKAVPYYYTFFYDLSIRRRGSRL